MTYDSNCYICKDGIVEEKGKEEWYCGNCSSKEKYGPTPYSMKVSMFKGGNLGMLSMVATTEEIRKLKGAL